MQQEMIKKELPTHKQIFQKLSKWLTWCFQKLEYYLSSESQLTVVIPTFDVQVNGLYECVQRIEQLKKKKRSLKVELLMPKKDISKLDLENKMLLERLINLSK